MRATMQVAKHAVNVVKQQQGDWMAPMFEATTKPVTHTLHSTHTHIALGFAELVFIAA